MENDNYVKAYIPHEHLIWVAVDIVKEDPHGVYDVIITDPDFAPSANDPARRTVDIKHYPFINSLPLQNDIPDTGVPDMTALNYLHEASILDNLRKRFHSYLPYTYTGDVCVAINPYKWLPIYTDELGEKYVGKLRHELEPHVYATSAAAFSGLKNYNHNQTILASGESGAGKTETVKILMRHIAQISNNKHNSTIEKVLKANPLMESFGNAKTARNDNSSRFGKFTQLQFDSLYLLSGSKCVTYLLEKSRVVQQAPLERNYHIFHQIFAAPEEVKFSLHMAGLTSRDFLYTNEGDTETNVIEGETDDFRFLQTLELLELLGVEEVRRDEIIRIIAGILYLGQVYFQGDADTSAIDPEYAENASICCELLGLSEVEFYEKTTSRKIEAEGHETNIVLSLEQAFDSRDALAKDIYDKLFLWLVKVINASTSAKPDSPHLLHHTSSPHFLAQERLISLLDIFGFETFEVNHFEQLCINFANEKLQQKFTQDVFELVQNEYKAEGLEWEAIDCRAVDNSEVLDLLEGKMGIIALLNEECMIPKGSDSNYLSKITHACKHSNCFSCSVHSHRDEFCIQHYAGGVFYSVSGFVERNRDALPAELSALMRTSVNSVLQDCFSHPATDIDLSGEDGNVTPAGPPKRGLASTKQLFGRSSKRSSGFVVAESVTTKFRNQLDKLMSEIATTTVRYVRCIKPNAVKSSQVFTHAMVTSQLRCAGLIEAIRISRSAYPYRVTHGDFLARFGKLRPKLIPKMRTLLPAEQCALLLGDVWPNQFYLGAKKTDAKPSASSKPGKSSKAGGVDSRNYAVANVDLGGSNKAYELGRTKVYFSSGVLETLERIRGSMMFNHIAMIQKTWRGHKIRKLYLRLRRASIALQKWMRKVVYTARYKRARLGTITLQAFIRRKIALSYVKKLRIFTRASTIQSFYRMIKPRKEFKRVRTAAVVLTAIMKMKLLRKRYLIKIAKVREDAQLSKRLDDANAALAQLELEKQEIIARQEEEARRREQAIKDQLEAEKLAIEELSRQQAEQLAKQRQIEAENLRLQLENQRVDEVQAVKSQLETELEKLREKQAQEIVKIHDENQKDKELLIARLENEKLVELENQRQNFDNEKSLLKQELEKLRDENANEIRLLKSSLEDEKKAFEQFKTAELEALKLQYETDRLVFEQNLKNQLEQQFLADKQLFEDKMRSEFEQDKSKFMDEQKLLFAEELENFKKSLKLESEQELENRLNAEKAKFVEEQNLINQAWKQDIDRENTENFQNLVNEMNKRQLEADEAKAQLEKELADLRATCEKEISELKAQFEEYKVALQKEKEAEIEAIKDFYESEKADILSEKEKELKAMEAQFTEQLQILQSEKNAYFEFKEIEVKELHVQFDSEIESLKLKFAEEQSDFQLAKEKEVTEIREQLESDLKSMADEKNAYFNFKEEEMRQLQEQFENDLEALRKELTNAKDTEIKAIREKFDSKILELENSLLEQKLKMEEETRKMLSSMDDESKEQIDMLTKTLKDQLEDEKRKLESEKLVEVENVRSECENQKTAEIADLRNELESQKENEIKSVSDKFAKDKDNEINELKQNMETEVKAFKDHSNEMMQKLKDQLKAFEKNLNEQKENEINDLIQQFQQEKQAEIEIILKDAEDEKAQLAQAHKQEIQNLSDNFEAKSKEQIENLKNLLTENASNELVQLQLSKELEQQNLLTELQEKQKKEIEELQKQFSDSENAKEIAKANELNELRSALLAEIENVKADYESKLAKLAADDLQVLEGSVNELKAQHKAEIDQLNDKHLTELMELAEKLTAEGNETLATELEKLRKDLNNKFADEREVQQQNFDKKVIELNAENEEKLAQQKLKLQKEAEDAIAALKQQQQKQIDQLTESFERSSKDANQLTKQEFVNQLLRCEAEKMNEISALSEQIEQERQQRQQLHKEDIEKLVNEFNLQSSKFEDAITQLQNDNNRLSKDIDQFKDTIAALSDELNASQQSNASLLQDNDRLNEEIEGLVNAAAAFRSDKNKETSLLSLANDKLSEDLNNLRVEFDEFKESASNESVVSQENLMDNLKKEFAAEQQQKQSEFEEILQTLNEDKTRFYEFKNAEMAELTAEFDEERAKLEANIDDLKKQLEDANAIATAVELEKEQLQAKVDAVDADRRAEMDSADQVSQQLVQQVDALGAEKEQLQAQVDAVNAEKDRLQAKVDAVDAEKQGLQEQVASLNAGNQQLQAQIDADNAERDQLQSQIDALNAEKQQLQAQIDAVNAERDQLQAQVETLDAKNQELQGQVDAINAEKEQLQAKVDAVDADRRAQMDSADQVSQQLVQQVDALGAEKEQLQAQVDAVNAEKQQLQSQIDALAAEKQELQSQVNVANAQQEQLQAQIDAVAAEKQELQAQVGALDAEKQQLLQANDEDSQQLREAVTILNADNDRLVADVTALTDQLSSAAADKQVSQAELEELKKRFEADTNALQAVIDDLTKQIVAANTEKVKAEQANQQTLQAQIQDMQHKLDEAVAAVDALQSLQATAAPSSTNANAAEDDTAIRALLAQALQKGKILADTVLILHSKNEVLIKEYTTLAMLCNNKYMLNVGKGSDSAAAKESLSPTKSMSPNGFMDEASDIDSPVPLTLNRLSMLGRESYLIQDNASTTNINVEVDMVNIDIDINSSSVNVNNTTINSTTVNNVINNYYMNNNNNMSSDRANRPIVTRAPAPRLTSEQRAEALAAKKAAVEQKKNLLQLLSQHRDDVALRVHNDGVDVTDPTSRNRTAKKQEQFMRKATSAAEADVARM